ncbi:WAT1-related protein At4g16620 isoform X2 [Brassica rapa]|uniref:WAT1-related protein At4g16620 isoform X2 n=1 Tax=Brassica campestris TaxID=3711 RepID=UPI00142E322D|nr:WAT1-related protein At4g16620 isoform X2 [Brassica rapa]
MMKRGTVEEVGIIGGLVLAQVIYAGNSVLLSQLMSLGVDPLLIVIFCTLASFVLISPLAFLLERYLCFLCFKPYNSLIQPNFFYSFLFLLMFFFLVVGICRKLWPTSLSFKLKTKLVYVSIVGVTLFQWLFLEGMKHTSASMATAMPNLAPAFIFVIAWAAGMEKVKLSCMYSRVKMGGTVLCVMGAFIMSLMHSTTATSSSVKALPIVPDHVVLDKEKILGCICLLLSICCLSSSIVLQASILVEFPAISMFSIVTLMGGISTVALQYVLKGSMEMGRLVNGGGMCFSAWVIKRKGPVIVSLFSPIATVVCVLVSAFTMKESFNLGSFAGMGLMFGGLYFVLWAKGKEDCGEGDEDDEEESVLRTEFDLEKPLLR